MTPTSTIVVAHAKCADADQAEAWEAWYDDAHLPDLLDPGDTATVATRWVLADPPAPGRPGLGFSHVTMFEFADVGAVVRLESRATRLREEGSIHPAHCITGVSVWNAHGAWTDKPAPSPELHGQILAEVMPANPADEAAWDEWYESQHVPDMLDTGAFAAATRWERAPRWAFGPNHLTAYDITHRDIGTAVEMSAQALPGLAASGRKFSGHTGVLTLALVPTGRHGGSGYRPAA